MPTATSTHPTPFIAARRTNQALTASLERRALHWLAAHSPGWLTSDQLTLLGLTAQIAAGIFYVLAHHHRRALLTVNLCIALNWLGDSLDGTLARVRSQQRPRYGFYVDHVVDVFGSIALMSGLACSGFIHPSIAIAMLVAFLLLAAESYLATYTLSHFELSQGLFGPTEIRILLILGNFALLRNPCATLFHHGLLLFDIGGSIAATCMVLMAILLTVRHTVQLYREEPLP
jgi:archaetidylinositol phosphate synthase